MTDANVYKRYCHLIFFVIIKCLALRNRVSRNISIANISLTPVIIIRIISVNMVNRISAEGLAEFSDFVKKAKKRGIRIMPEWYAVKPPYQKIPDETSGIAYKYENNTVKEIRDLSLRDKNFFVSKLTASSIEEKNETINKKHAAL
jgi:hypothetical protein